MKIKQMKTKIEISDRKIRIVSTARMLESRKKAEIRVRLNNKTFSSLR